MTKRTATRGAAFAVIGALAAASAQAATTTEATSEAKAPSLMEKISLKYDGSYRGAAISNPIKSTNPGNKAVHFRNYVTAGYQLGESTKLDLIGYWQVRPFRSANERDVKLMDPYVRLSNSKLLSGGGFNLYADVRAYAPVSDTSSSQTALPYLLSKQFGSYEVPNSRVTLSVTTAVMGGLFSDRTKAAAQGEAIDLDLYANTAAEYRLAPTVTAAAMLEIGTTKFAGKPMSAGKYSGMELGLGWDVTQTLNISPYLAIPVTGKVTADTIAFNTNLSWRLL